MQTWGQLMTKGDENFCKSVFMQIEDIYHSVPGCKPAEACTVIGKLWRKLYCWQNHWNIQLLMQRQKICITETKLKWECKKRIKNTLIKGFVLNEYGASQSMGMVVRYKVGQGAYTFNHCIAEGILTGTAFKILPCWAAPVKVPKSV